MLDLRSQYLLPDDVIELRAFTHGAMPRTVPEMMEHFLDDWCNLGVDAWNEVPNHWLPASNDPVGWWALPEYLGDRFIAPLIGASAGTCIMQPNVHWAMSCLLSDVERLRGRRVVVTDDAFPSILHTAHRLAELTGFRLHVISSAPFVDRTAVLDAVKDDCALIILSHVGFTTGERLSSSFLCEVAQQAHRHGVLVALDGYHAVGTMPIEVEDLGIDVYTAGLLKEGSGSSGTAFIYIREGLDLQPNLTGWFGDEEPFQFREKPRINTRVRRRFLGGTTAIAPLYHAVEGIRILLDAGLDEVRKDSLDKTSYCLARAAAAGLQVRSPLPAEERSAMVIVEVERADLFAAHLKREGVYTDSRFGRFLRLAPFVWNTLLELETAFDIIRESLRTREYLSLSEQPGPVG
ncbi:MAG: aminotransferase class V-fold PLP-dependent enzyme [Rhodothermales bacterium]